MHVGLGLNLGLGLGTRRVARPSYAHNMVVFDGTNDYLLRNSVLDGSVSTTKLTFVAVINPTNVGSVFRLLHGQVAPVPLHLSVGTTGNLQLQVTDEGFSAGVSAPTIPAGIVNSVRQTIHVAVDWATSDLKVWVNGALKSNGTVYWIGTTSLNITALYNPWALCANSGGTAKFAGQAGLIAMFADHITDPALFYDGGDTDIDALIAATTLPTPLIYFGGRQTAANWNAGTNQGTGGNFTMQGGV